MLDEPLFNEPAVLIKRKLLVNSQGVASFVETQIPISVVPTAGDGSTLDRTADGGIESHNQRFYTKAPLSPGLHGEAADRISWDGRLYQVRSVGDWTRWGQGFVSAACQLIPPDGGTRDDIPSL